MFVAVFAAMPVTAQAVRYGFLQDNQHLTPGQRNIVLRARQVYEIEWTPVHNVIQWGERGVFDAGVTVKGLPYGMPNEADYVPLQMSFSDFLAAVDDGGSLLYTSRATRTRVAPYYSLDCSAFISWAWGLNTRHMTGALFGVSRNVGTSLRQIQVGDAINKRGIHAVLVTDIHYDSNGSISAIGIMELIAPKATYTLYGHGGTRPLSEITRKYLSNGYSILRYNNRENVVYAHDCAVPIDGDYCILCISSEPVFRDVPAAAISFNAVQWAHFKRLVTGSNDMFSPDENMTRAQFALVLYRYAGSPPVSSPGRFLDVPASNVAHRAVTWAHTNGIVTGSNGRFLPDDNITREQMALMLFRYNRLYGGNLSSSTAALNPFSDISDVSGAAVEAMQWAVTHGLMTGRGSRLLPGITITREQVILILHRYAYSIGHR